MQVRDIIGQAVEKVGLAKATAVPNDLHAWALGALNRVYSDVWASYPFRDEKLFGVAVTVSDTVVVLPQEVEAIRRLWTVDEPLFPLNELIVTAIDPGSMADQGTACAYMSLPDVPVAVQPTAASQVTLLSDNAADTQTVRVRGISSGVTTYEDIALNGTSEVTTTASFTELEAISMPLTYGRVTVKAGSTELGTIPPWSYRSAYRRIRLYPAPETVPFTVYVEALRRFPRLTSDNDTVLLAKAETAIFDMLIAELCEFSGQPELAAAERNKGGERLQLALTREEGIDGVDNRSFPAWGMFGDDSFPLETSRTGIGVGW